MNEPEVPINIPNALKTLAELTGLLMALKEQNEKHSAPVSVVEPASSPTAQFNSTGSDAHQSVKRHIAAMQNLRAQSSLNQQLSNRLEAMERDAEDYKRKLEANTLAISAEILSFDNIQPKPPDEDCPGEEWRHP